MTLSRWHTIPIWLHNEFRVGCGNDSSGDSGYIHLNRGNPSQRAYAFGSRAKAGRAALASLPTIASEHLASQVQKALSGGARRDLVVDTLLARESNTRAVEAVLQALGNPCEYTLRERRRIAVWLTHHACNNTHWPAELRRFPLESTRSPGEHRHLGYSGTPPVRLFAQATASDEESFTEARLGIAFQPGDGDATRKLRDAALKVGALETLAALLNTGWLDKFALERSTQEAFHALDWPTYGQIKLAFARRVAPQKAALGVGTGPAKHLAAIVEFSRGQWRRARDGLAAFLPSAAAPYLIACFHQDGVDSAGALASVYASSSFAFLLRHARLSPSTRAADVIKGAAGVPLPCRQDPLREALILALARAVEVGRPTPTDRAALDQYLAAVPAWHECLPPADRVWQRAAMSLANAASTPAEVAASLQDLLLVEPRATWFLAIADSLLWKERDRWLLESWGAPTPLGIQALALVAHVSPRSQLTQAQHDALMSGDVAAALKAMRAIARDHPGIFEGQLP